MQPDDVVGKEIAENLARWGQPYPPPAMNGTASNIPVSLENAGIFARLTDRSRKVINQAHKDAEKLNLAMVYSDILLQAIVREQGSVAWAALKNLGLLEPILAHKRIGTPMAGLTAATIPLFHEVKSAVENAGKIATAIGHPYIGTEHILLGLLEQPDCVAVAIMSKHVKLATVRAEVLDLLGCADPKEPVMSQPVNINAIVLGSRVQHRLHHEIKGTVAGLIIYLYKEPKAIVEAVHNGRFNSAEIPLAALELIPKE